MLSTSVIWIVGLIPVTDPENPGGGGCNMLPNERWGVYIAKCIGGRGGGG